MKTMTCREMGGPCDAPITASSFDEASKLGTEHVKAAHPEMAADMEKMTPEDMSKWEAENRPKWDAKPEDAPAAV